MWQLINQVRYKKIKKRQKKTGNTNKIVYIARYTNKN